MNKIYETRSTNPPFNYYGGMLAIIAMAVVALVLAAYTHGTASAKLEMTTWVPLVATSARSSKPPVLLSSIELVGAECPSDIDINPTTGNVYITNEFSDNVSLLNGTELIGHIDTGNWPVHVKSDPLSATAYVSHVHSGVTVLDGGMISGHIDPYHEAFDLTVNTRNGYTYVTDLGSPITIIRGTQKIKDLFVPDFEGHQIQWQLAAAFDEGTGLTYFANWEEAAMTVVDGLEVVDQYSYYGQGANDLVIDAHRRLMYIANLRAQHPGRWKNNISIVDLDTQEVTPVWSATQSRSIAMDATSGYVYVTNTGSDSVTVLRGKMAVATYKTGAEPRGVVVDQQSGFAYVANSGETSVSVLRDGALVTKIELPQGQGFRPYVVAVDPKSQRLYVVNRSSIDRNSNGSGNAIECRTAWVHIYG